MLLLGVDAGQTATKVALFDVHGREVHAVASFSGALSPRARWQERDMDRLWDDTAAAVRRCLAEAGADPADVLAVGLCGHNDGAYLVDAQNRPVRPAILATDSRAVDHARRLSVGADGARLLRRTGQVPFAGSPISILSWLAEHEAQTLARVRWLLFCKDWLRLRLTGLAATDRTEASASFTDVHTQRWSPEAARIADVDHAILPPILESAQIAGYVTADAAAATGLREGTPVAAGAHDADASAIGIGAQRPGDVSIILGTFSINQVVAAEPRIDRRWQARSFVVPQQWLHMSTSAAGAANLDWVLRSVGMVDASGSPDFARATALATGVDQERSRDEAALSYLPFLFGSPFDALRGPALGAGFLGLRGWHTVADMVRAVLEGVVHNHRTHVDFLRDGFELAAPVRVCGGGARSTAWTALLSDALRLPVEVTDAPEAGARGAAILAGVAIGRYRDVDDGVEQAVRVVRRHEPGDGADALERSYGVYRERIAALLGSSA